MDLLAFFSLTNNAKMMAMCIRCFKNICDGNPTTQAQLFAGDAIYIFQDFCNKNPLLGILLCKIIFWKDNYLLAVNQELFDTILDFYRELLHSTF